MVQLKAYGQSLLPAPSGRASSLDALYWYITAVVAIEVNDIGKRVIRVKRPDVYFDASNPRWPEWVEIPIKMPPLLLEAYGTVEQAQ